jgi:outer membrane protein OmpA-like peptidoglycan-associated protein
MKTGDNSLGEEHLKLPTIPLGTGLSIRLSDQVKVNLGTQWSWVNTDRLDGRRTDIISGNIKMGNTESDIFGTKLYTQIGFSYAFGKKKKNRSESVVEVTKSDPTPEPKHEPIAQVQLVQPTTVKPVVIGNSYKVYFGFNKFDLDAQGYANLDKLARELTENPTVKVEIKCHTDSRGSVGYNIILSEKRGKTVVDYLVKKGIDFSRVNVLALGKSQPVNKCAQGTNCSKAEYAQNRRTETIITE